MARRATHPYEMPTTSSSSSYFNSELLTRVMGFSFFASLFSGGSQGGPAGYIWDSARLLILGFIIETGRRVFQWVIERVRFQYSITAQFTEGDPAYEWIILFLTDAKVWKSSRDFRVSAKSSTRKWGVEPTTDTAESSLSDLIPVLDGSSPEHQTASAATNVEYVPTYEAPQLFRWKGYWVEIKRQHGKAMTFNPMMGAQPAAVIYLTIYSNKMKVLSAFVEDARLGYLKTSRPHVIVHSADQASGRRRRAGPNFGPVFTWSNAKSKARRPLSSIILQEGVIKSLVSDAKEFLNSESWYTKAGIPHRRGYLLWGPPGTGKSSTIYAIAGELGLEIYSLSLASNFVDDSFLSRAVAAVPKNAIFLIEDIDCAFPTPRDASDSDDTESAYSPMGPYRMGMPPGMVMGPGPMGMGGGKKSMVTLSGLLNTLDGVGSEEGKLFFATTNYIDHLDHALLRPGRIDKKIQYKLATQAQAEALFLRFYPEEILKYEMDQATAANSDSVPQSLSEKGPSEKTSPPVLTSDLKSHLQKLASAFSTQIPAHEFSTAELQGYLLSHKTTPSLAAAGASEWVKIEQEEKLARQNREAEKKKKAREEREGREAKALKGGLRRIGVEVDGGPGPGAVGPMSAGPSMFGGGMRPTTPPGMAPGQFFVQPPNTRGSMMGPVPVTASVQPMPAATAESRGPMPEVVVGPSASTGTSDPSVPSKPLVNGVGNHLEA